MGQLAESIEVYVSNQIKQRQKILGFNKKNPKTQAFLNSRTSWIKLASGVSLISPEELWEEFKKNNTVEQVAAAVQDPLLGSKFGGGTEFPQSYILFNGNSSIDYNFDKKKFIFHKVGKSKITVPRAGIGPNGAYDSSDP